MATQQLIRRVQRAPFVPKQNKPSEDRVKLTSDVLVSYLQQIEDASDHGKRHYAIRHLDDDNELEGVFFEAKTPCGAFLKIYRYMQDEEIPLWMGSMMNHCSIAIEDLLDDGPIYDLDNFKQLCNDWIKKQTVTFSKILTC